MNQVEKEKEDTSKRQNRSVLTLRWFVCGGGGESAPLSDRAVACAPISDIHISTNMKISII